MIFLFFAANGPVVRILTSFGINPPQFLTDPESFRSLYIAWYMARNGVNTIYKF